MLLLNLFGTGVFGLIIYLFLHFVLTSSEWGGGIIKKKRLKWAL